MRSKAAVHEMWMDEIAVHCNAQPCHEVYNDGAGFFCEVIVGIMVRQCCPLKLTNQLLYLGIHAYPRHMKYIVEYASKLVK